MVTSQDVARLAGVSQATVSRVLQGSARVSPETRERVQTAMKQAGYHPNAAARAMRTRRAGTIGVVVADITNPFYPQLLEAVSDELGRAGQRMTLWNATGPSEASALEAIREGAVDGLLFTTVTQMSKPLEEALQRNEPVVLLHRGLDDIGCDQVTADNVAGGRLAARYLVGAGHERIGFLRGPQSASTALHRERGFREMLGELGHPLAPELVRQGNFSHDTARAAMRELLDRPHPPSAVFCANDLTALGAVDGAISLGVRVPEDVWVVGYDDIAMAAWEAYGLTTVRQPITDMARMAVRMLIERIEDRTLPARRREFPAELVVRRSTAHTPAS
ncbi:LacI family DNA-binding transcriptional regulator [Streptomyces sp. NEAU-YJ-81]|uniref:LacI family DNA-binding transcriptional regulator n=1 Tax=Streptomyces sp. NEAU-YJ-81 TaxID=2820288 RepID=UPI001ABC5497|nr:LacI family DNA-binding transcriptional regulator [Streptomyces sp. NEAU-YJ-81]MBO3676354.1 LacI family DNA-binding transcriptional regulator [Streptomyces sp. NEAU-YJ-81]